MKEITAKKICKYMPQLRSDMHKYSRGLCELMVGSERYPGAGILASRAANVMGAGYVRVYSYSSVAEALRIVQPSIVCVPEAEYMLDKHETRVDHPCATVVGSGLVCSASATNVVSLEAVSARRVLDVLCATKAPVVVDGAGLAVMALNDAVDSIAFRRASGYPTVITPHYGEAMCMLNMTDQDVVSPQELCRVLAQHYGAVCVLKGPDTYIANKDAQSDEDVYIMSEGTAVLAKAGTGDLLAGMIGSLLAQQVDALNAACLATYVHASAGNIAFKAYGVCATTEQILEAIPEAIRLVAQHQLSDISSRKD